MDPTAALFAGLVAGLAIAMQVGAVSLLLIEASVVARPARRRGRGMGVATADLAFAAVAAAAGGAAGAALSSHEARDQGRRGADAGGDRGPRARAPAPSPGPPRRPARARRRPARRGALRALPRDHVANPLTIASFAAVAAALSLDGPASAVAFAAGVGTASAAWHLALTLAAGHAARWMTPRIRRGLAIGGRLLVLAIALRLALGA